MARRDRDIQRQTPLTQGDGTAPQQGPQSVSLTAIQANFHQQVVGPLPSSEELARIEVLNPGATKIIMDRWVTQSDHRMSMEKDMLRYEMGQGHHGRLCAVVICVLFLLAGSFLVYTGHDVAGGTIATAALGSGAGIFIWGSEQRRKERQHRAELMAGAPSVQPAAQQPQQQPGNQPRRPR